MESHVSGENRAPCGRAARILRSPEILFFSIYAAITAFMTWPAATILSRTYAERRDPLGVLWDMWWMKYAATHHLSAYHTSLVAFPFGLKLGGPYSADPLAGLLTRSLVIWTNETVAYNLLLLLSFFLSAISMYYLVRYLTKSRGAAFFCGAAFAFSPYMLMQGKEHLGLVMGVPLIPLFTLALVRAVRRKTVSSIVLCGAAFVALTLFAYQYGLIAGIFGGVFIVTAWLASKPWRRTSTNARMLVVSLVVLLIVGGVVAVLLGRLMHSPIRTQNRIAAAYIYSARPWDYFIPHAEAVFLGPLTSDFILSHLHGSFLVENSLFLGYVPLALAALAVFEVLRRRSLSAGKGAAGGEGGIEQPRPALGASSANQRPGANGDSAASDKPGATESGSGIGDPAVVDALAVPADAPRFMLAFGAGGLAALIMSMPPSTSLLGVRLYFPSYIVFKILPQFRAFARFGVIVLLCVLVLAGYGIVRLLGRSASSRRRGMIVGLLTLLVLLEFTIVPPFRSLATNSTTDYYRWLEGRPASTSAAIYPLLYGDDFYSYGYLFNQRIHQKKLLNGSKPGTTSEGYRNVLMDILHPATPGLLRYLGVKYVMVIPSLYGQGIHINYCTPVKLDTRRLPQGLKEVARFTDCTVYEVTAEPAAFVPLFSSGTYEPEIGPDGTFWRACESRVAVDVFSRVSAPQQCDISFWALGLDSPRNLTVRVNEEVVAVRRISRGPTLVQIKGVNLLPGSNTVELESDGRPVMVDLAYLNWSAPACFRMGNILVRRSNG
jgi:hypothetical protein